MRTSIIVAAVTAGLLAWTSMILASDGCAVPLGPACHARGNVSGASRIGSGISDPCGCGHYGRRLCGLFGHKCDPPIDGLSRFANCGCNGSYNYPVPPLYTYHWPGMYKKVGMTDYHSPRRYPPLKRYEEDPLPAIEDQIPAANGPRLLHPASLQKAPSSLPIER